MIFFLYGKESFLSLRKLKEIKESYEKNNPMKLNLKHFNLKETNFEEFRDAFQTKSIFKEKKLFLLKNAFANQEFKKNFLKSKIDFSGSENIIVFFEEEVSQKDPLFVFLKKEARSQEFKPLKGKSLEAWVKNELTRYGAETEPGVARLLIELSNNDLWRLANEIRKLINYKNISFPKPNKAEKKPRIKIAKSDVELLVHSEAEENIFKTINSIALKQKQKAIAQIHRHLKKGDSPLYLFSMIAFQFRKLLIIKDWTIKGKPISKLNWHPYLAKKTYQLSQNFSLEELKKIYQRIGQLDLDIKVGKISPELALDLFVSQI